MPVPASIKRAVQRMAGSRWFERVGPKVVPPLDRFLYRVSGGRILTSQYVVPSLILVSTGAKTGAARETPLACLPAAEGVYLVGSNFGRASHPAWTFNLMANPECRYRMRGEDHAARARLLDPTEKAEAWSRLVENWPTYDRYVEKSGRDLRVFLLEPA